MDKALHPLTFVATGIYGKPLPKQHGAPVWLVVPWKYGYKSIKSNVNPKVPHPRWSQAFERLIDTDDRVRTQPFTGCGNQVAKLYGKL